MSDSSFINALFINDIGTLPTTVDGSINYFHGIPTGINWCEADYDTNQYIAEFWNTTSNLAFVICGLICLRICFRVQLLPLRYYSMAYSIIGIGIFSGWFHATLQRRAQKADETIENVVLVILYYTDHTNQLACLLHVCVISFLILYVTTILCCEIHLVSIVFLSLSKVKRESAQVELISKGKCGLRKQIKIASVLLVIGAGCWLVDRLLCSSINRMFFINPQLHAWWHVVCAMALYQGFIISAAIYVWRITLVNDRKSILPLISNDGILLPHWT